MYKRKKPVHEKDFKMSNLLHDDLDNIVNSNDLLPEVEVDFYKGIELSSIDKDINSKKKQKTNKKVSWGQDEEKIIPVSQIYYEKNLPKLEEAARMVFLRNFSNIIAKLDENKLDILLEKEGLFFCLVRKIDEARKAHIPIYNLVKYFNEIIKTLFVNGKNSLILLRRFYELYNLSFNEENKVDIFLESMRVDFISGIKYSLIHKKDELPIIELDKIEDNLQYYAERGDIFFLKQFIEDNDVINIKNFLQTEVLGKFIFNFYLNYVWLNKNYELSSDQENFILLSRLFSDKGMAEYYILYLRELNEMAEKLFTIDETNNFYLLISDAEKATMSLNII